MNSEKKTNNSNPKPRASPEDGNKENRTKAAPIEKQRRREDGSPRDSSRPPKDQQQASEKRAQAPPKQKEEKPSANRPTIHMKKDISSAPMWAKGTAGPSFADMVRQKAETKTTTASPPPSQRPPAQEVSKPAAPAVSKEAKPTPPPAAAAPVAAAAAPAAPAVVESRRAPQKEAEIIVEKAKPEPERIVAPPAPAPSAIPSYYILEVERVERVKLPAQVVEIANASTGVYTFSALIGKPPTPPMQPQQPQQTMYRADAANLLPRWNLGDASRVQPQQQQPHWQASGQGLDYYANDRNTSGQRYPAMQYSSYPSPQQQQQLRSQNNYFSQRSEAPIRPPQNFMLSTNRTPTNGGGVW